MKFLRRILSHIMFIIFLAILGSVYYFRNQILPDEYVQTINMYAEKVHPKLAAIESSLKIVELKVVNVDKAVTNVKPVSDVTTSVAEAESEVPVAIEKPEVAVVEFKPIKEDVKPEVIEQVADKEVVNIETSVAETIVEESKAKVSSEDKVVAVEVVAENIKVDMPVAEKEIIKVEAKEVETIVDQEVTSVDKNSADYKVILQDARVAYTASKFKLAIDKYKELIALENHEADFHGELGNVYYSMGNWSMAAESYFEAAQRLIDKGDMSQVFYLQRVLQGLDKNKAIKLATYLEKFKK